MNDDLAVIAEALDLPSATTRAVVLDAIEELKLSANVLSVELAGKLGLDPATATSRDVLKAVDLLQQVAAAAPAERLLAEAVRDGRILEIHKPWWREQFSWDGEAAALALADMPRVSAGADGNRPDAEHGRE